MHADVSIGPDHSNNHCKFKQTGYFLYQYHYWCQNDNSVVGDEGDKHFREDYGSENCNDN